MKEKKLLINAFFVLIIVMLLPKLHANAEEKYTYKDYSAVMELVRDTNLRTEPSLDGEVVGAFEKGTKIEVTGVCNENGWYRTLYNGNICYVTDKNVKIGYRGLKETSKSESSSDEEPKTPSEAASINTEKTTKSTNGADSDTVTSQDLLNIFLVIMLFCGVLFVIFKSERIHTPDSYVPESKPKKKKPDNSIFGIDWDGDGEVDFADDYITMDLLEDDI